MNRLNMQKLINALVAGPLQFGDSAVGFNMESPICSRHSTSLQDHSGANCETVASIAGYAAILAMPTAKPLRQWGFIVGICGCNAPAIVAQEWLGLLDHVAQRLFVPVIAVPLHSITLEQVVTTLKNMVASPESDPMPDWLHITEGAAS